MSKVKKILIIELALLMLVLIVFIVTRYKLFAIFPQCIVNRIFGIQCPSCGATRCVTNFILGNWKESFSFHPIFFITILYLLFVNIIYIINCFKQKKILEFMYPKFVFWIVWTVILIIFTILRNIV